MTYSMRDVPEDLWRRLHAKATREGRSLRYVILTLVERYCDGQIVLAPHSAPASKEDHNE